MGSLISGLKIKAESFLCYLISLFSLLKSIMHLTSNCPSTPLVSRHSQGLPDRVRGIDDVINAWRLVTMSTITAHCGVTFIDYFSFNSLSVPMYVNILETPFFSLLNHPVENVTTSSLLEWYLLSHSGGPRPSSPSSNRTLRVWVAFVWFETCGEHL